MSDAMRSFAFRRHTRHEHKTVAYASFMCLVVTAIAAAEFQRRIRQARLKPTRSGSHTATTRDDYNLPPETGLQPPIIDAPWSATNRAASEPQKKITAATASSANQVASKTTIAPKMNLFFMAISRETNPYSGPSSYTPLTSMICQNQLGASVRHELMVFGT